MTRKGWSPGLFKPDSCAREGIQAHFHHYFLIILPLMPEMPQGFLACSLLHLFNSWSYHLQCPLGLVTHPYRTHSHQSYPFSYCLVLLSISLFLSLSLIL